MVEYLDKEFKQLERGVYENTHWACFARQPGLIENLVVVYPDNQRFLAYSLGQNKFYSVEPGESRDAKQDPKITLWSQSLRFLGSDFGIRHLTNLLNSVEQDWERLKRGLEILTQNSPPTQSRDFALAPDTDIESYLPDSGRD